MTEKVRSHLRNKIVEYSIWKWREWMLTNSIEMLREIEQLEAVPFEQKYSLKVEQLREDAQAKMRLIMAEIDGIIDGLLDKE